MELHFDVLILIFKQIESFDDKVNFAKAHPNLKQVFEHCQRLDVRKELFFDNNEEAQLTHWRFILEWWGPNLTTIVNKYNYIHSDDLVEAAAEFCPNLEFLHVAIEEPSIFAKFAENFPKLRMLKDIRIRCNFFNAWGCSSKNQICINNIIGSLHSLKKLQNLSFGTYYLKKQESK